MILYELNKKRALTSIIFEENLDMDKDDKWFIDIKRISNKTKKTDSVTTIIKCDLDNWLRKFTNEGWVIIKNNINI